MENDANLAAGRAILDLPIGDEQKRNVLALLGDGCMIQNVLIRMAVVRNGCVYSWDIHPCGVVTQTMPPIANAGAQTPSEAR